MTSDGSLRRRPGRCTCGFPACALMPQTTLLTQHCMPAGRAEARGAGVSAVRRGQLEGSADSPRPVASTWPRASQMLRENKCARPHRTDFMLSF